MIKIKDNVNLERLKDYGFWLWESKYCKDKEWKYSVRGKIWNMAVKDNRYFRFNSMHSVALEKLVELCLDGLIEITNEKPPKRYAYMTKLELEKELEKLQKENKELKEKHKEE